MLIALILITSTFFLQTPPEADKNAANNITGKDSAVTSQQTGTAANINPDSVIAANLPAGWAELAKAENKTVTLENADVKVSVSSKGGKISQVELKNYKTFDGKPVMLIKEGTGKYSYRFTAGNTIVNTEDLYFTAGDVTDNAITMTLNIPGGKSVQHVYALDKTGFMLKHRLVLNGMQDVIPQQQNTIGLNWESLVLKNEQDSSISSQNTTVHYNTAEDDHDYLSETGDEEKKLEEKAKWVSFKQQFFSQTLISEQPFASANISTAVSTNPNYLKDLRAQLALPYEHKPVQQYNMQFYFGPLHYKTLKSYDLNLEKQIPLGWGIFGWVNKFIVIPAFNFLGQFIGNYGIIILLLTLYIKLILLPLTYKSYLSTAKMRLLKPELDELKAKYGDDMAQLQQEQMRLYRKAGVSPFGGCLPLLLQFPILIAMFRFFPASIELRQESFLWAHDLSTYDSILDLPFEIPFYGSHVSLFTLLMTATTLLQTRMNNSLTPQQPEFKMMGYIMPIFFLGFFNKYAAGLSMYYFFFNVITFAQQYGFKLLVDDKKLHAKIEANKKRPESARKGGLQKRLEDLANKQKEMQKNRAPKPPRRK